MVTFNEEELLGEDTMASTRPYQDVIAINELGDLDSLDPRRRREFVPEKEERFPWLREIRPEDDFLRFFRRKNGTNEGKASNSVLDANVYATKKTIAQGLLDVALLTANASQLKYLLQVGKEHEFYYVMMTLISLSIILQMSLGSVLIIKGRCDINEQCQQKKADRLNNAAVWIVFVSTVIHAFLSVFHIQPQEQKSFLYYNNMTISALKNQGS